jgi:hypothetical protein
MKSFLVVLLAFLSISASLLTAQRASAYQTPIMACSVEFRDTVYTARVKLIGVKKREALHLTRIAYRLTPRDLSSDRNNLTLQSNGLSLWTRGDLIRDGLWNFIPVSKVSLPLNRTIWFKVDFDRFKRDPICITGLKL